MYKVDLENKALTSLEPTGFSALGLRERYDLQEWVETSPEILGDDLLVIGKEVTLSSGTRIDLLCVDRSARLVVVELKRDDSGDAVEWQAIKYASCCANFLSEEIYRRYAEYLGSTSEQARKSVEEFVDDVDELNSRQRIILASREFNSQVLSAVFWLRDFGIDIQCTRLAPFRDETGQLFLNPETIVPLPEAKDYIEKKERKLRADADRGEWTGYWFVNVGEGQHRSWDDCRRYGFLSAGQGPRYSNALKQLSVGDKIYAYIKGRGYVGFGTVTRTAQMIADCVVETEGKRLLDCDLEAELPGENAGDPDLSEWVVGVEWRTTVAREDAKTFFGVFANQNVVCRLRHEETLRFVAENFGA